MRKETSITRQKIIEEAKRRGWQVEYFDPGERLYEIIAANGDRCIFSASAPQTNSWVANHLAKHKSLSYYFLQQRLGIKLPPFMDYDDEDVAAALAFLHEHAPIVVKPEDGRKSKGVTLNVTTESGLRKAVKIAREFSDRVLLQRQLTGNSYRLLVIGGAFFAGAYRRSAFVAGDGKHTVRELIVKKNKQPLRGEDGVAPLEIINLQQATSYLGAARTESVPAAGAEVEVLPVASVSAGGEAADVTDMVHPGYIAVIERAARALDLAAAGFDIVTPDITQPLDGRGVFPCIEVNGAPGFKMHYYPTAGGHPRNPAAALLDTVFSDAGFTENP